MATYPIRLEDAVSGVAGKIRSEIAKLRGEMRAIGEVNVGKGFNFSTWAKATVAMTAARIASEAGAAAMIRRTSAANREATAAAHARANAEARVGLALMRNLHYQIRLAHYAPRPAGGAGFGGGGGAGGGIGGGEGFATDPLGRLGRALPWVAGGAAAGAVGVGGFFAAKGAIGAMAMAGSAAISILGGVASAIERAAHAAGGLAFEFGKATVAAFDFRTRATMAFQALRGNGEKGFASMKALAIDMGTSLTGTFQGLRALSAAGFGASEAEAMFKRLQDMKGIGLDQPTLDRLVLAMSQIKGAGVLQGDELRQIQETGINVGLIWEAMAKKTGKTTAELKKMKEAGKLSADVAIEGIMSAMGKMAGGRAPGELGKEMARKTVEGFANRLSLIRELFFERMSKEAGISGLLEKVNTVADGLLKWMNTSDEAKAMFSEIGAIVTGITGDIGDIASSSGIRTLASEVKETAVAAFRLGDGIWAATSAFGKGLLGDGNFSGLRDFSAMMTDLGARLKSNEARQFFGDLGRAAREAVNALFKYMAVITKLNTGGNIAENLKSSDIGAVASGLGEAIGGGIASGVAGYLRTGILKLILGEAVYSLAADMLASGNNAGASLVSGFISGLWAGLPGISTASAMVGAMAKAALGGELQIGSPSKESFKIGGWYAEGMARGMAANDTVGQAAGEMAREVRAAAATGLGMGSGPITTNVGGAVSAVSTSDNRRSIGNITIQILGSADQRTVDDLEARLVALLERVA